ncbi:ABC transporter ATP-binding protein [Vibrio hippocampi]|uniref:Fe(3+) ions import ATP-binding protein FbpC 2 n=1 Tax=Vibrio hippocampi TaxID=654686 RepID=A0ABN8DM18_9VIBR|nr:ABC transporter ATP-binding protein [Vibrio hippocampi]CAH0526901.1 Fe(3+) ions import ATP-binding protein FbpC 2 [Vibrio hippocampi]
MTRALTIENLSCQYDSQTILEALSLQVNQGEIVCLLGASGCGKTTLLKAIAGLLPLSEGTLKLGDRVIDNGDVWTPPEQRNIGMIFQDYALFPHLTVAKNVAFGLKQYSAHEVEAIVKEMLALVHLSDFADRYPHQLSGGQQQRVAIARSLAYKPDLLLLDEPFSNIDTQVRHELIQEIRKIFKAQGVTAIFVTHSREEAFAFADKMAVMNKGVIEQYGTASELYFSPSSQFVADFLGGGSYLEATHKSSGTFETKIGDITLSDAMKLESNIACQLLLRPQHIKLYQAEESDYQVVEQQFMGDHCRYLVDAAGMRLLATSNQALAVGDNVNLDIDSQHLVVFENQ